MGVEYSRYPLNEGLYQDLTRLTEARMEVRAVRVVIMPALVMETVCCSMVLWRMAHVVPDI